MGALDNDAEPPAMGAHRAAEDVEIALPVRVPSEAGGEADEGPIAGREKSTDVGTAPAVGTALPVWLRFLPALIFYPIWLRTMIAHDLWEPAYRDGWPMAIVMVAGSLIAGSTPLGGGVVAFPVSVLVLKLTPKEGRDFACLIQSVGMVAAAYLILTCKRDMLHMELIVTTILAGTWGLVVGFSLTVNPLVLNVVFTTVIISFALIYFYLNEYYMPRADRAAQAQQAAGDSGDALTPALPTTPRTIILRRVIMVFFAVGGGVLSAQLGSGSDTASFVFTVLVWNSVSPKHDHINMSVASASSVVIMAAHTVETAAMVLIAGGSSPQVYHCLLAAAPIVVLGAPLGSLLLRPSLVKVLQRLFYVLALVQFVSFAYLKVKTNMNAWAGILSGLLTASLGIAVHFAYVLHRTNVTVLSQ